MSMKGTFASVGRALRTPKGAVSGAWLALVVLGAILAPVLTPYAYDIQDLPNAFAAPSAANWLGSFARCASATVAGRCFIRFIRTTWACTWNWA